MSSSTLVDPALVSVLGVAKDGEALNSEEESSTPGAKAKKTQSSEESRSRNVKDRKIESAKDKGKAMKKTTDCELEAMDQKWLEHFSRLEAMMLSKSFNPPEPVFQPVVSQAKSTPASAVDNTQPFFDPQPTDHHSPATDHTNWPLCISSLLTNLSLITGLVLLPNYVPTRSLNLHSALQLWTSSKHQRLIWILVLTRTQIL